MAIIVSAGAIFFTYTQFNSLEFGRVPLPDISRLIEQDTQGSPRDSLGGEAFRVGRVSTVEASDREMTLPDLFERTEKSVVQVSATDALGGQGRLGTGFVFDDNGHIVTNHHVVSGVRNPAVTFYDGTIYSAVLMGSDPFTDLAVLYVQDVPKEKLAPLPLADSTRIRVGEQVAAIGNPFGLSSSMTSGIISGIGRTIPAQNSGPLQFFIPDIIQTDAPINPGNSGGPLLNTRAQVVGINTAIRSTTGEFAGIGFAVPSNTIAKIIPSLIETGRFVHPWVGISGRDMSPGLASALDLDEPRGILVVEVVSGGPAEKAGIRGGDNPTRIEGQVIPLGGDIILELDKNPIRKLDDILVYLQREKEVGDTMEVTILRNGATMHLDLLLEPRPSALDSP